MASFSKDINYVYKELKKHRGEHSNNNDIPYIETLNGTFSDKNVLEGFCSNTETLCNRKTSIEDNPFYKMCIEDNIIIFDIEKDHPTVPIPLMTLERLKMIIFKRLKTGKACDINKLTVEHLRYLGDDSLEIILIVINEIINNINYLSSEHINTSLASIIHKGKDKPITHHKSYRQVRVTPLLARIIDEHVRPNLIEITKPIQNSSQYGFTVNISYLMAALQRHEVEKFCIDHKKNILWL